MEIKQKHWTNILHFVRNQMPFKSRWELQGGSIPKQLRMLGICRGAAAHVHIDLTLTGLETCRTAEKQTGISKDGGGNIWSCPQVVSSYLGPRHFFFQCNVREPAIQQNSCFVQQVHLVANPDRVRIHQFLRGVFSG